MRLLRKNGWKFLLDIVMAFLLALMYNKRVLGMEFHEIGGLALCGFFIIHKLLNGKWIKAVTTGLFSRRTPVRQKTFWVLDLLLLISFIVILVSGIGISKVVFPNSSAGPAAKILHYGASALALALAGVHLGLHMGWIGQRMPFLKKIPSLLRRALAVVLSIAVLMLGAYSVTNTAFLNWIANLSMIPASFAQSAPADDEQAAGPAVDTLAEAEGGHGQGGGGTGLRDGTGPHGSGNGEGAQDVSVGGVLMSFLSIFLGFAVLAAWIDGAGKALRRRRLRKTPAATGAA